MPKPTLHYMTAVEFRQLPETMPAPELIGGLVIYSASPGTQHQLVGGNLAMALAKILTTGALRFPTTDVYLDEANVFQPDLMWVAPDNDACRVVDGYWYGPPTMVIEILVPNSTLRDRREKFRVYERAGVQEYWMVDLPYRLVEIHSLENGEYQRVGIHGNDERFTTPVLAGGQVALKGIFELSS